MEQATATDEASNTVETALMPKQTPKSCTRTKPKPLSKSPRCIVIQLRGARKTLTTQSVSLSHRDERNDLLSAFVDESKYMYMYVALASKTTILYAFSRF